jgi:hypothetical protein
MFAARQSAVRSHLKLFTLVNDAYIHSMGINQLFELV